MVYQVPASRASLKQNVFEFQVPGSRKIWTLPLQQFLPADISHAIGKQAGAIRRAQAAGEEPDEVTALALAELQAELIERYCPGLYALVDAEQLQDLVKAWGEASRVGLGESSASAPS